MSDVLHDLKINQLIGECKPGEGAGIFSENDLHTRSALATSIESRKNSTELDYGIDNNPCESGCFSNEEANALADLDGNHWIYILGHDQLKKRIIKTGHESGIRPTKGQIAEIKCSGRLDNGTVVDDFDKIQICLGEEEFLLAFDLCIPLMHIGEVCELVTESRFAYGKFGRYPDIPQDSKLTYNIELLCIKDKVPYSELSNEERLKLGNKKRLKGNSYYEAEEYNKSISEYMRALKIVEEENKDKEEILEMFVDHRVKCYNNMAAAQMHIEAWDAAISSCNEVLKLQPNNVKALFRKGRCLASKGEVKLALIHLKDAAKIAPEKIILHEVTTLQEKSRKEGEVEKALYQKMLGLNNNCQKNVKKKPDWRLCLASAIMTAIMSISFVTFRYAGD